MANTKSDFTEIPKSTKVNLSYAEALLQKPFPATSLYSANRDSHQRSRRSALISSTSCYRCGGDGHFARACRDPVKCFKCGRNGHKQLQCPSRSRAASSLSGTALAQSWLSMVYHDDSIIRNSEYSREEINEELFNFNLNFLKLRKSIALSGAAESVYWVRLLDGLYNSSYKATTVASLLLDDASLVNNLDNGKKDKSTGFISDYSFPVSNKTDALICEDVLLLDPVVDHYCHFTTPFDLPPVFNSSFLKYSTIQNSVATSSVEDDEPGLETGCICLISKTADTLLPEENALALPFSSSVEPATPRVASTDLTLFNSFDLLGFCVEDETSDSVVDTDSIDPTVVVAPAIKCDSDNLGARLVVENSAGRELQRTRAYSACYELMALNVTAVSAGMADVDRCSVATAADSDCLIVSGNMSGPALGVSRGRAPVCNPTEGRDVQMKSGTESVLAYALSPTEVRDVNKNSVPLSCCESVLVAGFSNATGSGSGNLIGPSGLATASNMLWTPYRQEEEGIL